MSRSVQMLRSPSTPHSALVRGVHRERLLGPTSIAGPPLSPVSRSESPEYPGPALGAMSAPAEEFSVLAVEVATPVVVIVLVGEDVCIVVVVVVVTGATLVSIVIVVGLSLTVSVEAAEDESTVDVAGDVFLESSSGVAVVVVMVVVVTVKIVVVVTDCSSGFSSPNTARRMSPGASVTGST